ncbi:MAG: hypothetical protein ACRYFX_10160 [Janthinobacterium lividum]
MPASRVARALDIEARLVITWPGGHEIQVAGAGSYLIVNVPSQQVLDLITSGPPQPPGTPKPPKPPGPDPLQQLHDLMRTLGLVLDLRVGGKTYVTFGLSDRNGPKITLNAVLGKIGSFFK